MPAGLFVRRPLRLRCTWPSPIRWGRRPTNSSTLPLDYGRNLTIVLVAVWVLALVVVVVRVRAGRTLVEVEHRDES
ncbi:MAG: hypothetical protein JWN99_2281 [Ilumatobacteraceae bacterium]|nr:hypothetical protein [Ilumatobacteraceae bacterium]